MKLRGLRHLLPALVLALVVPAIPGFAQQITATLSGTVTDSTGGVVPGAHVIATNTGTNAPFAINTNESG